MSEYCTNYRAYAASQGREPDEQAEHDDALGSAMAGFLVWSMDRQAEYKAEFPGPIDHHAYAQWLEERYLKPGAGRRG